MLLHLAVHTNIARMAGRDPRECWPEALAPAPRAQFFSVGMVSDACANTARAVRVQESVGVFAAEAASCASGARKAAAARDCTVRDPTRAATVPPSCFGAAPAAQKFA